MDLIITILPVVTKNLPISPRFTPYNFLSRSKFSILTTRQPMVEFYLLTFPRFPLRKKEHKSYFGKGGSYGNKILYKNLDLTQDFPNKISFHFLWVKMLPKNLPKIFRWPEICPLDKILAQDSEMAAFTKILGRRDTSVVPLLSRENCKTLF